MTRLFVALAFLMLTALSALADDTFSCLNDLTGPLTVVEGTGYVDNDWFNIPDGMKFDVRGAVFLAQTDPVLPDGSIVQYPVDLRADLTNTYCWAGGVVHFTNALDITWEESKYPNNAAIIAIAGWVIFDGVRIHNAHDGIRPRRNTEGFWQVRNSWISYNRDDCIENDFFASGLVENSLFDGCAVFLSSRNKNEFPPHDNIVTVRNSLVHLQAMPGPSSEWPDPSMMGHGPLFKWDVEGPRLNLHNNIFMIDQMPTTSGSLVGHPGHAYHTIGFMASSDNQYGDKLLECSGNIVVWLGPGEFPGDIPDDPSCVTVTTDRAVWDEARATWLDAHPLVMRIEGVDDVVPEPIPEPEPTPEPEPEPDPVVEPEPEPLPKKGKGWWCRWLGICWK